jgi:NADPH-dependent curcumin reductase CurA
MPVATREWQLAARPHGEPAPEDFRLVERERPDPGEGQVVVRMLVMSVDPYMRGRMNAGKSYAAAWEVGETMKGGAVGRVVDSRSPDVPEGALVLADAAWRDVAVLDARHVRVLPELPGIPPSYHLGVLGMPGLTAWVGLEDIGQPKAKETVVVSAASGAVGQVVGQIAKIRGCRVVGIAGGKAKCDFVTGELGFDACADHHGDLAAQLDAACPGGVDVYWENVGGAVQAAVWPRLNDFGRMVMCGMVAQYNEAPGADASGAPPGPNLGPVVRKRLRIQGFIVSDSGWQRYPRFRAEMLGWMREGRMKWREDVVEGLRAAPEAFIGLLKGANFGKLVVRVE